MREMDKLHTLYDSLMDARRESGDDVVPFHRFAALVKDQVSKLRADGSDEVAFRVSVVEREGELLTVRGRPTEVEAGAKLGAGSNDETGEARGPSGFEPMTRRVS